MNIQKRRYQRVPPSKDAQKVFIFCEGARREKDYFSFFRGLDSRIDLIIYNLSPNENNSPMGLYKLALNCLTDKEKHAIDYEPSIDIVWFIIDKDDWGEKIIELKTSCLGHNNWKVSVSNPCFEVWLYYHFFEEKPELTLVESMSSWKEFVNSKVSGGFDSRKHPSLIEYAIRNSEKNFAFDDNGPLWATTEVHFLAKIIYTLVQEKI